MSIFSGYSGLLGFATNVSSDLLTGWYATRGAQAQNLAAVAAAALQKQEKILPPWDARAQQPTPDQRLQSALNGTAFIDEHAATLADPNASASDHKLFALYNGLAKLSAIVNHAADKKTSETMLGTLNKRFQSGLNEVLAYAKSVETAELAVVAGQRAPKLDAGIFVPRGLSQYTTKILQRTAPSDPMPGLSGTEKFTIAVTKGSVTTNVDIDLSEMGTAGVKIDDLISFLNTKLTDAGMVTKFKKIRLDTLNNDGTAKSPPPQNWGLSIQGTSTERLSFSSPDAGAAVYLAGNSGKPGSTAAQLLKLDASGASPSLITSARIEADAIAATDDGGPAPVMSDNSDPKVAAALAEINKIRAGTKSAAGAKEVNPPTTTAASAVDSEGNSYIVGTTAGTMDGLVLQGEKDVFLTKIDSTGHVVWQRMIGDDGVTEGLAVAVDASGNVAIAGKATGNLTGGANSSERSNSFVTKFDRSGQELWTRNVGPVGDDAATAITIAADGAVYFGGNTKGALASGITAGGGQDGFVTKLTSAGKFVYNRQFGGTGNEGVAAIATDASGNLVVLSNESGHAVVRKYDSTNGTGAALWSQDLGDLGGGAASAIAIDGTDIHVGGWTETGGIGGGTVQGSYHGGTDGFVISLDTAGAIGTTTYVGTGSTDRVRSLTVKGGDVYVAGDTTGNLGGGFNGVVNGFAAKLGAGGTPDWVYQYAGREGHARSYGIAVDEQGASVLDVLGLPKGRLDYAEARSVVAQSTVRPGDEFFIAVNGGAKRRIVVERTDTLNALTVKINRILVLDGRASVRSVSGGNSLRIAGNEGDRIDLIAGAQGKDALKGLGFSEGTIVVDPPKPLETPTSKPKKEEAPKGPLYVGLGLASDLSIDSRASAGQVNSLLQTALGNLRKAFRDINPDPALAALSKLNAGGPVPQHLRTQLANYRSGLARLGGGSLV